MPSKNEKILQMSKKFEKIKKEMAAMKKRNSEMQKNLAKMIKALEGLENDNGQLKGEKRKKLNRHQVDILENEFSRTHYPDVLGRTILANKLDMTESQVKVWFQNRRTKYRKYRRQSAAQRQQAQLAAYQIMPQRTETAALLED